MILSIFEMRKVMQMKKRRNTRKTSGNLKAKRKSGIRGLALVLSAALLIFAFPLSGNSVKTSAAGFAELPGLENGEAESGISDVPGGGAWNGAEEAETEPGETEPETSTGKGEMETESETGTEAGETETESEIGTEEGETGTGSETETKAEETETGIETEETETESGTGTEDRGTGTGIKAEQAYSYRDESVEVKVILPAGTAVPADAVLTVCAIADTDKAYDTLVRQAEKAVSGEAEQILFYDISFYTAKKEYISVEDTAKVSIRFKKNILAEESTEIKVLHYGEEKSAPVAVEEVDVERGRNDALSGLGFEAEGFSIYAVVAVSSEAFEAETPDVKDLDGKSYAILSNTGRYAMLAQASDTAGRLSYRLRSSGLADTGLWTFTSVPAGAGYYISCGAQYLRMDANGNLTLTARERASAFEVSLAGEDGQHVLVRANGNYINSYGGEGNMGGFAGWPGNDAGSQLLLYKTSENHVMNLNGKSFAIVNQATGVALTNEEQDAEANQRGMGAQPVTFLAGTNYVKGDRIPEWFFEDAGTPGCYYISIKENGVKKYLHMELKTSAQGSLTLSEEQQAIQVTSPASGVVLLEAGGGYINSSSSKEDHGFWVFSSTGDHSRQRLCQVMDIGEIFLAYDLNATESRIGNHEIGVYDRWLENSPSIEKNLQEITGEGNTLYSVSGAGEDGYFTREYITGYVGEIAAEMREDGKTPGKQFRFDGWKAETGGNVYLFAEGAPAALREDGIHITDTGGMERVLPAGTVMVGQWTEVSDIVTFYVNYSGTILDREGDVSGRNQQQFTGVIGIGHVYYGAVTVGNDGVFASAANEEIRIKFTKKFEEKNPECQIVMDYVTADENGNASLYRTADGINDTELEIALLNYIKNSGTQIKISTADNKNNPAIENENATPENYSVRWYVLKEQQDGWHIDGVMVAKSAELTVAKTFSGLSDAQIRKMMEKQNDSYDDSFQIPVQLGESAQPYITMVPDGAEGEGQYSYYGQEHSSAGLGGQSYVWVLNAITNEKYTLSEQNYGVEGYDVSMFAVSYYRTESGGIQWYFEEGAATTGMDVVGGRTIAVTFNNLYTRKGTGALAIIKRAAVTGNMGDSVVSVLEGAEFTLTGSGGTRVAAVSNSRGSVYFSNLGTGTYILKETKAPVGYLADSGTWTVEVEETDGRIRVTVYENDENGVRKPETAVICYDGGVTQNYRIENTPDSGTVRVSKTFEGLTAVQLEKIVQGSSEKSGGYCICLDSAEEGEDSRKLYLQDAVRSQDGSSFSWTVPGMRIVGETGAPVDYQISEHNYLTGDYVDTMVTAAVNGEAKPVRIERGTASASGAYIDGVQFSGTAQGVVELTNRYINHFTLRLQKLDRSTGQPLKGAEFSIYGAYRESEDTSESLTYEDPVTGERKTVYYISRIISGEDGLAVQNNLKLSKGDNTFVYILNEDKAPDGYMASTEPTILTVHTDSANYDAGVYTATVDNSEMVDVTVEKKVTGNLGDRQKAFRFTAKVTDGDKVQMTGITAPENAGYTVGPDGTFSFELRHGESVRLKLPWGYQFTVTENAEDSQGYQTSYSSGGAYPSSGIFTVSEGMVITVQNHKDTNIDTGTVLPRHSFPALLAAGIFMALFWRRRRRDEG